MTEHECDDALTRLYEYLDNELDESTRSHIEEHLQKCSPCLEAFDFEAELRKVIADRSQERVSADLRSRILAALEQCSVEPAHDVDPLAPEP
jgi:mycothiol system anti-sigma-R factor